MTLWPDMAQTAHSLRYVRAGPVRTRCLEAGGGEETLIFLYGAGGDLEAYLRNIPVLRTVENTLDVMLFMYGDVYRCVQAIH